MTVVAANRLLAERCEYPLHLGVTEAGPAFQGTIKSAVAFGIFLTEGIGDTIRVSLSAPPTEQVNAGCHILQSLGLRPRKLEIVSCPGCGRLQVDIHRLAAQVETAFDGFPHPLRIAVMGCVVNGPGESREADLDADRDDHRRMVHPNRPQGRPGSRPPECHKPSCRRLRDTVPRSGTQARSCSGNPSSRRNPWCPHAGSSVYAPTGSLP